MYKLLIVDDELLVLVGIKSMLDWEKEGISIVGAASNGEQAYALIVEHSPDIVITDIIMPVMDGLALMEKCRSTLEYQPQFILLTSHEDFQYARKAIGLGAADYLVKLDLNADTLQAAIGSAKERCGLSLKRGLSPAVGGADETTEKLVKLAINNLLDEEKRNKLAMRLGVAGGTVAVLFLQMKIANEQGFTRSERDRAYNCVLDTMQKIMGQTFRSHCVGLDKDSVLALVSVPGDDSVEVVDMRERLSEVFARLAVFIRQYFNTELGAGVSSLGTFEDIAPLYAEAREAYGHICQESPIRFYTELPRGVAEHRRFDSTIIARQVLSAYEVGDVEQVTNTFLELDSLLRVAAPHYDQLLDACHKLLFFVLTGIETGEDIVRSVMPESANYLSYIRNLDNSGKIIDWLRRLGEAICESMRSQSGDYTNRLVVKTKQYISAKIQERLTLGEVAGELGISPGYLSNIFKRYADCGFSDYVTRMKMDKAIELLRLNDKKIYEVSHYLGYDNAYYFSKVFKKYTGLTPKEYITKHFKI